MDDTFTPLLRLTMASEECWGHGRTFVERWGRAPADLSPDDWNYITKGKRLVARIERHAAELLETIERWHEANDRHSLYLVESAVGIKLPPYYFEDRSVQTAHEAAVVFAEAVHNCWPCPDGVGETWDFIDYFKHVARNLESLPTFPDPWARLQGEHHEASVLTTCGDDESDKKSDNEKKSEKYKRRMNVAATDCVRRYKQAIADGLQTPMETIVADYVEEVGKGSVASILRTLADNPDQWKADKKPTI